MFSSELGYAELGYFELGSIDTGATPANDVFRITLNQLGTRAGTRQLQNAQTVNS